MATKPKAIPGYKVTTGRGGIPVYTPVPKAKTIPNYTGTVGAGGIPIYTPKQTPVIPGYTGTYGPGGIPIYERNTPPPTLPPAYGQGALLQEGFGGLNDTESMQAALRGQWDWAAAEQSMRNINIEDDAELEAARLRGEADLGRFMGDLTQALGKQTAADTSQLGAAGRSRGGAALAMARARDESFNKQSTSAGQTWLDKMAELRSGVKSRKAQRMFDFENKAGDIAARLANDPRYAQRDPIYGPKEDLRSLWNTMNDPRARMYFQNEIGMGYENWVRSKGGSL